MSRISIDVTPEEHNRLKAIAALAGKSLKDYVLEKTLLVSDNQAIEELELILKARIREAKQGKLVTQSVNEIAQEVYREMGI